MNAWSIDVSKILLPDEIKAVWQDLNRKSARSLNTRQNRAIFLLATVYGLRCSEIRQLQIADLKTGIAHPYINLRKATTKRNKSRRVPLLIDSTAYEQVRAWKAERLASGADKKDPFVISTARAGITKSDAPFIGDDGPGSTVRTRKGPGQPLSRDGTARRFKTAIKILGPDRVSTLSIHNGRHSCASILLHQGMPIAKVQAVMGHSNLQTTSVYSHIIPSENEKTDYFSDL